MSTVYSCAEGGGGDDSSYTLGMDCIIRSSPCVWGRRAAIYNLSGVNMKTDSLTRRGVYRENVTNFDKTLPFSVKVSKNLAHVFLLCD